MDEFEIKDDESSLDDLLQDVIKSDKNTYFLNITDTNGKYLDLGSITITGRNTILANLSNDAYPQVGSALGVDFYSLADSPDNPDNIIISPLRLANALGLNVNTPSSLSKKMSTDYSKIELSSVFEFAQKYGTDIQITNKPGVAANDISIIPSDSIFVSEKNAASNFDYFDKTADKNTVRFFVRNTNNQLVAADVSVASIDGSHKSNNLAYQHAVNIAFREQGFPVPETHLLKSDDGNRIMLLTMRDGAKPFSAIKNNDGQYQTLTRNLHNAGGFCSVDRLRCINNGDIGQNTDPEAKLISLTSAKESLMEKSIPLVMFNHLAGGDALSGNDIGVHLIQNGMRRGATLSMSCKFNAPVPGSKEIASTAIELDDLASIPSLGYAINANPALATRAMISAKTVLQNTNEILHQLEKDGFCSVGYANSLELSDSKKTTYPDLSTEPFARDNDAASRFANKHIKDHQHQVSHSM